MTHQLFVCENVHGKKGCYFVQRAFCSNTIKMPKKSPLKIFCIAFLGRIPLVRNISPSVISCKDKSYTHWKNVNFFPFPAGWRCWYMAAQRGKWFNCPNYQSKFILTPCVQSLDPLKHFVALLWRFLHEIGWFPWLTDWSVKHQKIAKYHIFSESLVTKCLVLSNKPCPKPKDI